jgi:hypothetical protein
VEKRVQQIVLLSLLLKLPLQQLLLVCLLGELLVI